MADTEFKMSTVLPNGVTLLTSNEEFITDYRTEFWEMSRLRSTFLGVTSNEETAMHTHNAFIKFAKALTGGE